MTPALRFPHWLEDQIGRDDDVGRFAFELRAILDDLPVWISPEELSDYLRILGVPAEIRSLAPIAWREWKATGASAAPEHDDAPQRVRVGGIGVRVATPAEEAEIEQVERRHFRKNGDPR